VSELIRQHAGGEPIKTLSLGRPNWIARFDREKVWVETEKSRREATGPQPIPLQWIVDACDALHSKGVLSRRDLTTKSSKRSAFIFSVLALLPDVEWQDRPIELRLRSQVGPYEVMKDDRD
jgi:hypothetical protein